MKRYLILLLVLVNILSIAPVFADGSEILYISLEDAQARALENNVQYRLQDSEIRDALSDYNDATDARVSKGGGFMSYFNSTITYDVNVDSAANSVKLSRSEKENIKRTINNDVKTAFISIKKAQYSLEDAKNTVTLKSKDYEVAKIKHELGDLTSSGLKDAEKAYKDALIDQESTQKKLHEAIQSLNRLIGRPLTDYNIEPVITLEIPDIQSINLDKLRENYINNDKNLLVLSQNANLAQRNYDLTQERYDHFIKDMNMKIHREDIEEAYDKAVRDYDKARTTFEDATKELDITLNSSYNSLKDTRESIDRLLRDIQDMGSELQKTKIKYDLGLISKNAYEEAEIGLKTMQNKLQSAIGDYNILYSKLTLYSDNNTVAEK